MTSAVATPSFLVNHVEPLKQHFMINGFSESSLRDYYLKNGLLVLDKNSKFILSYTKWNIKREGLNET